MPTALSAVAVTALTYINWHAGPTILLRGGGEGRLNLNIRTNYLEG